MITSPLLMEQGWLKFQTELPAILHQNILEQDFNQLDRNISKLLDPAGSLYSLFKDLTSIRQTEYILTLRQSPDDEDGIWHDDGSRQLAFSLGLNPRIDNIRGGEIELRHKTGSPQCSFPPLLWGEVLVFLTGQYDWEHRVLAVTEGKRLHAAGWIN